MNAITRHIRGPAKVFVSYSHQDSGYLADDSLLGFLRGLEREGVEFWSDRRIAVGKKWDDEIRREIRASDVALVLVSQAFLDSHYCTDVEIPGFLERSREDGLVIFPVILSPCEWERHDWLSGRQFLPTGGQTIEEHFGDSGSRKGLFLEIRRQLRQLIHRRPSERAQSSNRWVASSPAVVVGERRRVTVLRCELGSVRCGEVRRLDPEEWLRLRPTLERLSGSVIERFGGHLEPAERSGTGLTAYFGCPEAHEDDVQRAVRAALEILRDVAAERSDLERCHPGGLAVRMGIHTGPAVVVKLPESDEEELIPGETSNLAAEILKLAEPETVVISDATHRVIEQGFRCESLGPFAVRGLPKSMTLYRALEYNENTQAWPVGPGRLVQPVGREQELDLLYERWKLTRDGMGQAVLMSGEAGVGKTRLVRAFKGRLVAESRNLVECRCSAHYRNTAFHPIIDFLGRLVAGRREAPPVRLERLEGLFRRADLPPAELLPRLVVMLSTPPSPSEKARPLSSEVQRKRILESLLALFLKLAQHRPLLLVIEDVHWIDPSTLELLTMLIEQGPTTPILTLLTYRPEFEPPWGRRADLIHLTLSRLRRRQVDLLIRELAGRALPDVVREQIAERSDGVPLFVEEITKMVIELDLVKKLEVSADALWPQAIPTRLRDWLTARLDALGPAKGVAQLVAALGRECSWAQLEAVSALDEAVLRRELDRLVAAELLYRRGVGPRAEYVFKHALLRDAAHESLLHSRRQRIHRRIAGVLEERFPATVDSHPELLAQHYGEAGLAERAVDCWQRAASSAVGAAAFHEAISHAHCGLELLGEIADVGKRDELEIALRTTLGHALGAVKSPAVPEVARAFARARELCRKVGKTPLLLPVLQGLFAYYFMRAELEAAEETAEHLSLLASLAGDVQGQQEGHQAIAQVRLQIGDVAGARHALEQGLMLCRPHAGAAGGESGNESGMRGLLAWVAWFEGEPDQALEHSRQSLALARGLAHPLPRAIALFGSGYLHLFRHEPGAAQGFAEELIAESEEQGHLAYLGAGLILRGWIRAAQGHPEDGIRLMGEGLDGVWVTGTEVNRPLFLGLLAETCGRLGQIWQGLHLITEALSAAGESGSRLFESELLRIEGELLELRGASQGAVEARFLQALDRARQLGLKSLELRAAMGLARQWQKQGKGPEAHALLSAVYESFREGFGTVDLERARALLEDLSERAEAA